MGLLNTLIYLDMCCFNRPYDAQTQLRIRLETEAKLRIQEMIKNEEIPLVWPYILDYEASFNPFEDRRQVIESWRYFTKIRVMKNESVIALAEPYILRGVKSFDALHVACARFAKATLFITTEDRLLSKIRDDMTIKALNPLDALAFMEKWYED